MRCLGLGKDRNDLEVSWCVCPVGGMNWIGVETGVRQ
jgi:hypothetical protein